MEPFNPSATDRGTRVSGDIATGTLAATLVVELANGVVNFHRLVSTLHRKHINFDSLLFSGRQAIVHLTPDHRSINHLASIVEREPVVIRVDIHQLDDEGLDHVFHDLLASRVADASN